MGAFLDKPVTDKVSVYRETSLVDDTKRPIQFAISSMQGWRSEMEDAHSYTLGIDLSGYADIVVPAALFSVFDGHGGSLIANQSAALLEASLKKLLGKKYMVMKEAALTSDALAQCLKEAYVDLDISLRGLKEIKNGTDHSGCTAISVLVTKESYIIANAGDSRCIVIGEGGEIRFASRDHKPDLPSEIERISKAGGYVSMKRVNGDLGVSRGMGDYLYKRTTSLPISEQQVTPLPDVSVVGRLQTDLFVVIACDGVWDVISNENCGSFFIQQLHNGCNVQESTEKLLDWCIEHESRDNMSAIVLAMPAAHMLPKLPPRRVAKEKTAEQNENDNQQDKEVVIQNPSTNSETIEKNSTS